MNRRTIHQRNVTSVTNVDNAMTVGSVARRGRGPGRHGRRGPGPGPRGGRRNRVSRGEVRAGVLMLLADQPMHGYQLMQELEERSGGNWQPSPGSIYPTLQQLADEGLIVAHAEGGKNVFTLTDVGHEAVAEIDGPPVWERFAEGGSAGRVGLRQAMFQLGAATKQVAAAGTDAQAEAAHKVLTDARKSLYRILAEDDEPQES